ncbi:MAG: serine hydrolase domain-containing protein [Actinomycetota bacterium]
MTTGTLDGLIARCRREIDEGLLPSCQLALAKDGELIAFETIGDATVASRYTIFSATKGVVSAATWLLLADNRLRLDQRVADIIPGFGANGKDEITVEHVLRHVAGFPQAFLNPFDWDDQRKRNEVFASWTLDFEPGSRYSYHGVSAAWVMCAMIETIAGTDYRTFIQTQVIDPLDLGAFRLGLPEDEQHDVLDCELRGDAATLTEIAAWGMTELPADWRKGYQELLLFLNDPRVRAVGIPAGGAVSTAADVAMFYQGLLRSGLWSEETLKLATEPFTMPDDLSVPTTRGLGVQIAGDHDWGWWYGFGKGNSPRAYGHDGAGGQIAWVNPETGVSFCYLTNGLDENIQRQKRRMLAIGSRAAQLDLA